MKRSHNGRILILSAVTAVTTVTAGLAAPSLAVASTPTSAVAQWHVVAQTPGFLDAIVTPAPSSAWALGWIGGSNGTIAPVARQWNGKSWTSVTLPRGVKDSGMACAGASAPDNVWSFFGAGASLGNPPATAGALRLQNGQWVVKRTFPGSYVTGCNVLSRTDVWVFGGLVAGLGPGVGTWHLTSSGWAMLNTGNLVLVHASVVSPNDIWAAGAAVTSATPVPVLGRWNGMAWTEDRSIDAVLPKPTSNVGVGIDAINALSDSNVGVDAFTETQGNVFSFMVVHWDGSTWSRVTATAFGFHLSDAVPDGHGGWWAPPFVENFSAPYLLHGVNGQWTRFPLPIQEGASVVRDNFVLAHVPQSAPMFAVGDSKQGGVVLARGTLPG
jgi:hypothetical protein